MTQTGSSAEMPFLDHLEELRWRIIWSLAALVVGVVVGFALLIKFEGPVLLWLQGPMLPYLHGRRLMNTHPGGGFSILMQTAFVGGIVFALPVILYQIWAFLSPALHKHEKRIAIPVIVGAVFLFLVGATIAWYFVLPMTLRFLTGIGDDAFDQMISANEYFGFVTALVLAMGAVFELPILVLLLSALGLVTPKLLSKFRRHAMVGSFVVAAFITPGDLFVTNVVLTVMLYMLYELSIILSFLVFRNREKKRVAEEAAGAAA
ncbi:MAG: Sec-independent protein translocase, TatC subunit [Gemmatimonadetes bacterium]|jgi:sec-independent protein translocase protein TatC|nr:Sec-independent protein translocase, TatC subunit [Gemmatimonadota bacterium]